MALCILGLYLIFEILTIPFLSIVQLPTENPTETALMRQRIDEARDKGTTLNIDHRWTALSSIPRHVRMAILVSEDGTFYSHAGVDWHEVQASLETNWEQGRIVRGGSTITQQLAKNLYLSTSRDPVRKTKELFITWMLESTLSKKRIFELYLNIIEWGHGVFGIEAAAQRYFHKPASLLSREEGARLAAVIPSPLRHRPTESSSYVIKKKELILRRMSAR
ncbi:MAG: monofunctional biosynthetic peptidoglycan transglycosylase [Nitrospirales bacterium]|nr:MAG: monofunctional biosynthetic peptidoglycan transglycosylase [Nitrospirales bacterium]